MAKYWVANNPNSEITNAKAQKVANLSATSVAYTDLDRLTSQYAIHSASPTALAADGALSKGVTYHVTDTGTSAYTLPAAADSTAGDIIKVLYIAAIADSEVHKYGTSGEFFADTSYVLIPSNAVNAQVYTKDVADGAADDFLNLTGASNAGWGIGTSLTFIYNGSKWHVECHGYSQGTGAVAATGAFAAS